MSSLDLETVDRLLTTTKQVRKRLDMTREVPTEILLECIDIASRAPIGANLEKNRWLIVKDPELKKSLAELYRRDGTAYIDAGAEQTVAAGNDPTQLRVIDSARHLLAHLQDAPVLIVPLRIERPEPEIVDQASFWGSVVPGVWSLQLALRARGIGSAWTTLHLYHEEEAAALLGLPDTVTQIALLPAAYYTGDDFRPAKRRPARDITYLDRWKQPI